MNGDNGGEIDDWSDFDFDATRDKKSRRERSVLLDANQPKWARILAIGLVGGALVPVFAWALNAWIIRPVFCRNIDTAPLCAGGGAMAFYVAVAIIGALSAWRLVKHELARPVLVALLSSVALAELWPLVGTTLWSAILIAAIFGGLFYLLFSKIAQLRNYFWSLVWGIFAIAIIWLIVYL